MIEHGVELTYVNGHNQTVHYDGPGTYITSLPQVLVQTALYGYVLFVAANMIGDGAELLLLVPKYAALVGSVVLPILGAVPDGMMVLCSGLGPPAEAQQQVKVGVGALAGSTIMLLTLPWFLSIVSGRVSIDKKTKKLRYKAPQDAPSTWEKLDPNEDSPLFHTGVSIGPAIADNAKIMLITCISYIIIQGAAFVVDKPPTEETEEHAKMEAKFENPFAWAALVTCCAMFFWYLYMMWKESLNIDGAVQDEIIQKAVAGIQDGQLSLRGAMWQLRETTWDTLCKNGGLEANFLEKGSAAEQEVCKMCKLLLPFFRIYDENGDNLISMDEFRMLLKDLREHVAVDIQRKLFDAADADNSGSINYEEFIACMVAFALDPNDSLVPPTNSVHRRVSCSAPVISRTLDVMSVSEEDDHEEDMPEDLADLRPEEQQSRLKKRAFSRMGAGTLLVLLFSDPMTDMLGLIGDMLFIDKFYVSFVLAPLASNASELVSAMKLARKRTPKSMVQSLSTLEGAAIMNNTFCLAIFMLLIIWKELRWCFSAETISILVIQVWIAMLALFKKTHTLADGFLIFSFYPMSLVIVYVLENVVGLD